MGEQAVEQSKHQDVVLLRVFLFLFTLSSIRFFLFGNRIEVLIYCVFAFILSWILLICFRVRKGTNNINNNNSNLTISPAASIRSRTHWQTHRQTNISPRNHQQHSEISELNDNNGLLTVITIVDTPSNRSPNRPNNLLRVDIPVENNELQITRIGPPSYDDAIRLPKSSPKKILNTDIPPPSYDDATGG